MKIFYLMLITVSHNKLRGENTSGEFSFWCDSVASSVDVLLSETGENCFKQPVQVSGNGPESVQQMKKHLSQKIY